MTDNEILVKVRPRFQYKPAIRTAGIIIHPEIVRLDFVKTFISKDEVLFILKTAINEPEKIKVKFELPEDKKILVVAGIKALENGGDKNVEKKTVSSN